MSIKVGSKGSQKGFTLVELLIVLALLGIVLAGVFQFFSFTHASYAFADSQSEVIQEINLTFLQLEKDIRSAEAPNSATKAVRIVNSGQQLDIYRYNSSASMYERISYRRNSNQLQRGWVTSSTQDTTTNPQYGTIPDTGTGAWTTFVSNLSPGSFQLFDDSRNDTVSARRLIDVYVIVSHPRLNNMISMKSAIMSRTGRSTTSIIASTSGSAYVPVTGITINPSPLNISWRGVQNQVLVATVSPENATNRNLIWSQQLSSLVDLQTLSFQPWVHFPDFAYLYDDDTGSYLDDPDLDLDGYRQRLTTRSGQQVRISISEAPRSWFFDDRDTHIKVVSPDGPETTLHITQPYR